MERYIISACLCGVNCKYNGKNNLNKECLKLAKEGKAILVCPEQLGGLTTPRDPSEISKNSVITKEGKDVTLNFINGAKEALNIANIYNVKKAILKEGSPSCGVHKIYDGTFSGNKISGMGIFAKLLCKNNIKVISSEEFTLENKKKKVIKLDKYN